jgi:hypothetical protein
MAWNKIRSFVAVMQHCPAALPPLGSAPSAWSYPQSTIDQPAAQPSEASVSSPAALTHSESVIAGGR